jgi:hypothetical protein
LRRFLNRIVDNAANILRQCGAVIRMNARALPSGHPLAKSLELTAHPRREQGRRGAVSCGRLQGCCRLGICQCTGRLSSGRVGVSGPDLAAQLLPPLGAVPRTPCLVAVSLPVPCLLVPGHPATNGLIVPTSGRRVLSLGTRRSRSRSEQATGQHRKAPGPVLTPRRLLPLLEGHDAIGL